MSSASAFEPRISRPVSGVEHDLARLFPGLRVGDPAADREDRHRDPADPQPAFGPRRERIFGGRSRAHGDEDADRGQDGPDGVGDPRRSER
jgi:hypothetical protein